MAKCTICDSRKGKRKCKATETFICSPCCGETRSQKKCVGCSFLKDASANRNYRQVPYYSTEEMANSLELEEIADVIEKALCRVWAANSENVNDKIASRLVEMQLDRYHFNDTETHSDDPVLTAGCQLLAKMIRDELDMVPAEKLVKVLAAVHRSIKRRTNGGSSYLDFVSQFAGMGSVSSSRD